MTLRRKNVALSAITVDTSAPPIYLSMTSSYVILVIIA